MRICPGLNSPADSEDEKGENKKGGCRFHYLNNRHTLYVCVSVSTNSVVFSFQRAGQFYGIKSLSIRKT